MIPATQRITRPRSQPVPRSWAELRPSDFPLECESRHGNFDNATFDRADLSGCAFEQATFRSASFRGADLSEASFDVSDLTGATYDCATKLPDDLDPVAAGMINVEGSCGK